MLSNLGNLGINQIAPTERLHVVGNVLASGSVTAATKSFDIRHEGKEGWRLRHWCTESDVQGGALMYKRHVTAPKAGLVDLIMPDWFAWLAKNVVIYCSGVKHFGQAWGEQDELDPCVIHINVSKGGVYNVLVVCDRADECATTMCPPEVEYIPAVEASSEPAFPQ